MTMTVDESLRNFDFWSGAADNAALLTCSELDQLEEILESSCDEPMSTTDVNDLMWFDFETVCDWLGLDYDEVMERSA